MKRIIAMIEVTDAQYRVIRRICQVEDIDESQYVYLDVKSVLRSNIDNTFASEHTERKELLESLDKDEEVKTE